MRWRCLLALCLWPLALPASAAARDIGCRVVAVLDGDTLQCLAGRRALRVRLGQVDAPETAQPYGQRAKAALAARVFGREVTLQRQDVDQYGRLVARVLLDGADINLQQVRDGWAWVYRQYAHEAGYYAAERAARAEGAGLWADARPVAPWDWRHGDKVGRMPPENEVQPDAANGNWLCGSKQRCSQMRSCAEARYHLQVCGLSRLDANHDGTPCEALCREQAR
ncbi:thermonuclease family protein [Vogesella sp. LIG4]|uniref:thermonuclease family protein n=1 Tax=Vogesella sp. LIG4 TaxID=1192162 RepID=UPI00081F7B53|nr:thermonuclease family protein [Vogesella sp. LIG4]SCK29509.1 Endonuclease YncB, thermonuclease family [Vogesella sp. LIG4]